MADDDEKNNPKSTPGTPNPVRQQNRKIRKELRAAGYTNEQIREMLREAYTQKAENEILGTTYEEKRRFDILQESVKPRQTAANVADLDYDKISDIVKKQLEAEGVFDQNRPLPSPPKNKQPKNRRAISEKEIESLGEGAKQQIYEQLGNSINLKNETVVTTPEEEGERLNQKPEHTSKRRQTRALPSREKEKGLGLFSQVIRYKFDDDTDEKSNKDESIGDKVITARTQAEAIKNVSDQLSNTNRLMSMSLDTQDESLKLLKQILAKVSGEGSSGGIFSTALGLLTTVIGGALTLGLGSVSGLFRILTNRNLALFGTMLAAGTLMTGVPSIDSLVSSIEKIIPDLDSIMESLGLEGETAPPAAPPGTPPPSPGTTAPPPGTTTAPSPTPPPAGNAPGNTPAAGRRPDATRAPVERTGEGGTPQAVQLTRETPTISVDPMGAALGSAILSSGPVREREPTPTPDVTPTNRQGLVGRGAQSNYANQPVTVTTAYPQAVRNRRPESLSGNHEPSIDRIPAVNHPANRMVPESLSGNHDSTPIRQTVENINTNLTSPTATRVESPPAQTQTATRGVAPPAARRMNGNPGPNNAAVLEQRSRAAAEASRPPASDVNVITNNQQSQQSQPPGGTNTTIDPNNPGPTEPPDARIRYDLVFGQY